MKGDIVFVGLNVQERFIAVALADAGGIYENKIIANTSKSLKALVRSLERTGVELRFCYECGPAGLTIFRQIKSCGHSCAVIAPAYSFSAEPLKKVRSAIELATLHRAGALTAVDIPERAGADEITIYVKRARLNTMQRLRQSKQTLSCFIHDRKDGAAGAMLLVASEALALLNS